MRIRYILISGIAVTTLSGCQSMNQLATDFGVNFWTYAPKKAPCLAVASLEDEVPCVGTPLEAPSDEEILELRGRYKVENGVLVGPIEAAP